jgi:hypothetical protein
VSDVKATAFAQQGLDFVSLFEAKFHMLNVSGYKPLLRQPVAETTGGGAQAVQHMLLEPKIEGDPVVTVGQVNLVTKTAKLRTFSCLLGVHEMRFRGRAFHVDPAQYQSFFDRVLEFMRRQGLHVQIETRPPEMATRRSAPPAEIGADVLVLALLVAVAVFSAVAAYLAYTGRLRL